LVNFDELTDRLTAYKEQEKAAWDRLHAREGHLCKLAEFDAQVH
jgi:hypothetical protein